MEVTRQDKERALVRTSWVSTIGNALLAGAKVAVGLAAGSIAVVGDGVDSAADVVVSVIMLVTAVVVQRPPSRKYPFGYDKAESVATIVLALVIFAAGARMLVSSAGIMASGEGRALPGTLALWVTVFSIAGKLALAWYQFGVGRRYGSDLIVANAKNMRSDVLISAGVLVGLFFTYVLRMPVLDAVAGCAISLYIIKTGIDIFRSSALELMDGVRDEEVYHKIFAAVARVPEALNPHHVRIRLIGGGWMIDLDVEVAGSMSVDDAHEVAERVEESIRREVGRVYDIEVHIEPFGACRTAEPFGVDERMLKK